MFRPCNRRRLQLYPPAYRRLGLFDGQRHLAATGAYQSFSPSPTSKKKGIFPILKEILAIAPDIKIMGSPWSCPKWMKGAVADPSKPYDSWTSGRLNPAYYDDYAEYFVQWVTEMEAYGFPIYAITMQNEPLNHRNSMSLYMPWEDQAAFVKKLGPAFREAGIKTKILCYDHNYDYDNIAGQQQYPLHLYADAEASQWIDGSPGITTVATLLRSWTKS